MKVCFWGNISGALRGETVGGGELQIALLAKALAKAGGDVVVVDPYCDENFITEEGIKVTTVPEWKSGLRVIRMFSHRIPALFRNLKLQSADVYYVRMRSFYNILPYLAAKAVKAKFVFAVASDLDVLGFAKRLNHHYIKSMRPYDWLADGLPSEAVLPYLLRHADVVLAQHETQKMELERKNTPSMIFQNLIDIQSVLSNHIVTRREGYAYVGSLDPRKGFKEFVDVAETVENRLFKAIGEARGKGAEHLCKRFQHLSNGKMLGRLCHRETVNHIANSEALICTSAFEGFPNTFLEAWSVGTPVISLSVDPGGVIEKHRLGIVCHGNIEKLKDVVRRGVDRSAFDRDALVRYVSEFHSIENAAESFMKIVQEGRVT